MDGDLFPRMHYVATADQTQRAPENSPQNIWKMVVAFYRLLSPRLCGYSSWQATSFQGSPFIHSNIEPASWVLQDIIGNENSRTSYWCLLDNTLGYDWSSRRANIFLLFVHGVRGIGTGESIPVSSSEIHWKKSVRCLLYRSDWQKGLICVSPFFWIWIDRRVLRPILRHSFFLPCFVNLNPVSMFPCFGVQVYTGYFPS